MIDIQRLKEQYGKLKRSILETLVDQDPLTLLEKRIFQKFQDKIFGIILNKVKGNQNQLNFVNNQTYTHQSRIQTMNIGEDNSWQYKIIQRRSHSEGKVNKNDNKIRRMQELRHIDLLVFSNILANLKLKMTERIPSSIQKYISTDTASIIKCQNPQKNYENSDCIRTILQKYKNILIFNPTPTQIQQAFHQLSEYLQQQNEKVIEHVRKTNKDLELLKKKQMQLGQKELRVLLKQKQIEKKNQENMKKIDREMNIIKTKKQQISERSIQLDRLLGVKVRAFEEEKIKTIKDMKNKHTLQELWMKVQLDSYRRNTLYELDKEQMNLKIREEQLQFKQPCQNSNVYHNSTINLQTNQISQFTP